MYDYTHPLFLAIITLVVPESDTEFDKIVYCEKVKEKAVYQLYYNRYRADAVDYCFTEIRKSLTPSQLTTIGREILCNKSFIKNIDKYL